MIFRVVALVRNAAGELRTVTTLIAGCADADDARAKFRRLYDTASVKSAAPVVKEEET